MMAVAGKYRDMGTMVEGKIEVCFLLRSITLGFSFLRCRHHQGPLELSVPDILLYTLPMFIVHRNH